MSGSRWDVCLHCLFPFDYAPVALWLVTSCEAATSPLSLYMLLQPPEPGMGLPVINNGTDTHTHAHTHACAHMNTHEHMHTVVCVCVCVCVCPIVLGGPSLVVVVVKYLCNTVCQ